MTNTKERDRRSRLKKVARATLLGTEVLVLNSAYQPINKTKAHKAIHLLRAGKAELVKVGETAITSIAEVHPVPSVIRLKRYVKVPDPLAVWSAPALFHRDGYMCQYCGLQLDPKARKNSALAPTIDHVVPKHLFADKSKASTWGNTVCACSACNKRKGGKTMKEAGMRFGRLNAAGKWEPNPDFEPKRPRSDFLKRTDDSRPDWAEWIPLKR